MDYTLGTLKDMLRVKLQDQEFDSNTLTTFINQSINEILGEDKYPFMQRIDTYQADEKGEIELPLGYNGTFYIYAQKEGEPQRELEYISPEDFFGKIPTNYMAYTRFANTIFYHIYKTNEDDVFNITHLYLIKPRPLVNDTDKVLFPPEYIEAVILGAMYRAEQLRDNFDYAQIYQNQQDQLLTNMKVRYGDGTLSLAGVAKLPYGARR